MANSQKDLVPNRVTYVHPHSGKTLTDAVLDIDYRQQTVTVHRPSPHSTAPSHIPFSEVLAFEYPACPACFSL